MPEIIKKHGEIGHIIKNENATAEELSRAAEELAGLSKSLQEVADFRAMK
jgi:methyl-accepting chemotaxis protein